MLDQVFGNIGVQGIGDVLRDVVLGVELLDELAEENGLLLWRCGLGRAVWWLEGGGSAT